MNTDQIARQMTVALLDAGATATKEEFATMLHIAEYYAKDGEDLSDAARQAVREVLNIWA